ncbi:ATP-binding protein [Acidobacteriota bacterium]
MNATVPVLVIDSDHRGDPIVIQALEALDVVYRCVRAVDEALPIFEGGGVDLVIIRSRENDPDPGETIKRLKADRSEIQIPVIVLMHQDTISEDLLGNDPVDVCPFPCEPAQLHNRIRTNLNIRRILRTAEERALKLASIIEISEAINQALDAGRILYNIATKLSGVMDLVRCSFILPDLDRNRGTVLACKDDPNIHNVEIDLKNYPEILKVIETGRFVMIEDVAHDPIMAKVLNLTKLIQDQSILTLPLAFEGKVIGILQVRKKGIPKGFSTREIEFCQLIANAAGIALKNVQLLEDIEKRNEILTEQKGELETLSIELRTKNDELLELQKIKEEFTAMIVHDLRSPMTIIQGTLEIMKSSNLEGEQKAVLIQDALGESGRILEMINNLLDISKLERGDIDLDLEPIELAPFLQTMTESFRILVEEKGIELTCRIPDELPSIRGDRSRLRQVFANLISNALEHTPDAGKVVITAGSGGRERPGSNTVTITVEDNGCGIPDEILPKIFDKFLRYQPEGTDEKGHHGTGLGLAIVKLFTEAHGGKVSVESKIGAGSSFSVTLPVAVR